MVFEIPLPVVSALMPDSVSAQTQSSTELDARVTLSPPYVTSTVTVTALLDATDVVSAVAVTAYVFASVFVPEILTLAVYVEPSCPHGDDVSQIPAPMV